MNARANKTGAAGAADHPGGDANGAGVAASAATSFRVAYHDGPPAITYAGSRWERDVEKTLTADEWAAIQARPSHAQHGFAAKPASAAE